MIQRVQTIWLLLAMACAVLLFYFPVWQVDNTHQQFALDIVGAGVNFHLLGFPLFLFITHAVATWSFKNRKRQLRFCNINILLFLLFLLSALVILQVENHIFSDWHMADFKLGFYLPLLGIVFNLMARQGIRRDEALIESLRRLR